MSQPRVEKGADAKVAGRHKKRAQDGDCCGGTAVWLPKPVMLHMSELGVAIHTGFSALALLSWYLAKTVEASDVVQDT